MKQIKQCLINLALGFVALCLLALLCATGESFPVPIPKTVTVTVPFSLP